MPDPPNTLCVLADRYLMANEVQTLENAVDETGVDVPLVFVNEPVNPDIDPDREARAINGPVGIDLLGFAFDIATRDRAWTLVYAEKKVAETFGSGDVSTDRIHVEDVHCLRDSEIRYVTPVVDGNWVELPAAAISLVRNRCDVCVRFGFGLLRGEVLRAPEFGVLSFHPADIRQYRGLGVPQAWLDRRSTMGVTLQRLTEAVDGGEIVAYEEVDVSGCTTLWEVYDTLYDVKADMLTQGIENFRDPSFRTTIPESLGPYYSTRRRRHLSFAGRTILKNMAGRLSRINEGSRGNTHSG